MFAHSGWTYFRVADSREGKDIVEWCQSKPFFMTLHDHEILSVSLECFIEYMSLVCVVD